MVVNDVLPPKAARRDAGANSKPFGTSGHQRLNFDDLIYVRYAALSYSAGTVIIANVNLRRVDKSSGPVFRLSGIGP